MQPKRLWQCSHSGPPAWALSGVTFSCAICGAPKKQKRCRRSPSTHPAITMSRATGAYLPVLERWAQRSAFGAEAPLPRRSFEDLDGPRRHVCWAGSIHALGHGAQRRPTHPPTTNTRFVGHRTPRIAGEDGTSLIGGACLTAAHRCGTSWIPRASSPARVRVVRKRSRLRQGFQASLAETGSPMWCLATTPDIAVIRPGTIG